MIKEFSTSISYVCPYCSSITVKDLNIFSLSSESPNLQFCEDETSCKAVCVSIEPKKNTYEIIISCPVCEDRHSFNINKVRFWKKDKAIVLKCPETGIGILFIGDHNEILRLIEQQESSILLETGAYSIPEELNVVFQIVEQVNNLSKNSLVRCSCGSHAISVGIDQGEILLNCRECGNTKSIPTTEEQLNQLLNASAIVLD